MPKFRKKPVVIEAMEVTKALLAAEARPDDLPELLRDAYNEGKIMFDTDGVSIKTPGGKIMSAGPGDWIIQGIKGELYPCKSDIFEATYSAADDKADHLETALLTGSRVYGKPTDDSDVDLVVLMEPSEAADFAALMGANLERSSRESGFYPQATVRMGKLNVIVESDPDALDVWRQGTAELVAKRPVDRDVAVATFKRLRAYAECKPWPRREVNVSACETRGSPKEDHA